ncbi:mycothiol system anti-sigma-R factor [Corynebacterium sp. A21]|uniref:mycothiol system anti-sigma-R factor n=1 Tax=Corynebacterium sp. A21 TaxID=3457318 RepID=UPI003FD04FCE
MTYNYDPCACGCEEKYQSLFALLDDELSAAECAALQEHIEQCPECYSRLTAEQQVRALVKKCCQKEAPPTLVEKITLRIRVERG